MKYLYFAVVCSVLFIINIKGESCNKDLIVELSNGKLKGQDRGDYLSYESIPYAEPPLGDLRFEAPQPYQQKWNGIFNATQKPKRCLQWNAFIEQENKLDGVEDCLVVNVYKPKTGKDKYPVIIYIHGGAFMFSATDDFKEEILMKSGSVILVSMSYRLGPLGFLSTGDDVISGNFGLKDQQLAIKWIKENISKFGGDTDKILLMGFSAGSAAAHLQMLQPTLKNTAKAVISFSGVALNPWGITKSPRRNAEKLSNLLQCPNVKNSEQIKNCLKNKKASDIVTSVKDFFNFNYNPFTPFGPVVEHANAKNAFITQHPIDIIKSGNYSQLPWLASHAAQDACYDAAQLLEVNAKTGKRYVEELNDKWLELAPENLFLRNIADDPIEYAKQLKQKYLGSKNFSVETYSEIEEMYTDIIFKNGIYEALKLHSNYGKAPIYGYVYDNPIEHTTAVGAKFGTCHADDFSLILKDPFRTLKPDDLKRSEKFIQMLEKFVKTGDLIFDDCKFVNNAGNSGNLKLLLITKDKCKTINEPKVV